MFSKFFIDHPVLSNVIAIVTMLLGVVALYSLPIEQYPEISPPTVVVSTTYPGANAETVASSVGAPLEQQINGVENMMYMSSKSAANGSYALTITFEVGTELNMATVLVQNRVNAVMQRLPEEVQRQGVSVVKRSPSILLVVGLTSPDGRYDSLFLSNYATLYVKDALSRVAGVGDINVFGADEYAMRVWLYPDKLKSLGLTAEDVVTAVSDQNVQVAAGQVGQPPTPDSQNLQLTIQTQGRLESVEQFENIIVKTGRDEASRVTRLKDVARVDLGGRTYDLFAQRNGDNAALIPIYLLPGANALDVANRVVAKMDEISRDFPEGLRWVNAFDTTLFVQKAVDDVYWTLIEAALLVLVVIMLFLQDWRAMLVPATTVPVTILGSFIAMQAMGFSVNLITLFAVILAIGIVVDDAIIVVEGAVHEMEKGRSSYDAAIRAMTILFGPIIGITLVLIAVFLPAAFFPGVTGQIYRQFALVIASTAIISAINAATLKPTQCALWLRKPKERKNAFFRGFNWGYGKVEAAYVWLVSRLVRIPVITLFVYTLLVFVAVWGFTTLPKGFLPEEDQGYCVLSIQLPGGASQARTHKVVEDVNRLLRNTPGVANFVSFGGLSILDGVNQSNMATVFVQYTPWDERLKQGLTQRMIVGSIQAQLFGLGDAFGFAVVPPAIRGLGQSGGFEMVVQDRTNMGAQALEQAVQGLIQVGGTQASLGRMNTTYSASVPQLYLDVNRTQAMSYSVELPDLFSTLQTYLGSSYVNDFNRFGRVYQVRVQADAQFRLAPDDIRRLEVSNSHGQMVPMGAVVDVKDTVGPLVVTRYNLFRAASVIGSTAPGISSGQGLEIMEQLAQANLPASMGTSWTGVSFLERRVGAEAYLIFALAVLLVYLVLAAQYESWFVPGAVILVTPLALLGTLVALYLRGLDNNIYTQVGIVLLIALASKNAILIVEYARELRATGVDLLEAAVRAAQIRFRPILMTSFAFIMGVTPLLTAAGAGSASQRAIGTAVFGGMIASTLIAVLVVPVFYVAIQGTVERFMVSARPKKDPDQTPFH